MTVGAQATKKPPFRKRGGWGDLYLYLYLYLHLHSTRNHRQPDAKADSGGGRDVVGDAARRESSAGEIPPTPLLRKGGF